MSDEQPKDAGEALTGEVHDAGDAQLVAQPNGGVLRTGGRQKPADPTPNDNRKLMRKRVNQAVPGISRIAINKEDKRSKAKPGPFKVADQIRAFEALMRGANDDTISVSDFRRAMKGFSEDIMRQFPGDTGERILNIAAPWFFPL